jgi:hypothetical protein
MDLDVSTLAERPDRGDLWDELDGHWPSFMINDPTGAFYYGYSSDDVSGPVDVP